ncbi:Endoplasmic reticulum aminopeptidase 2 [Daphnia magna]|uniref:Endoplasmic reticulum aminopeptidase 2 n=1 Tax=Daphnia magna TaxID=35525 RepID=A0A164MTE6_9CRUS|nr:Endoplasmic reticulum aminopeptidase 2 [Daphnia magna]
MLDACSLPPTVFAPCGELMHYEPTWRRVPRKQAVFIIGLILTTLLTCSLIIAFVRPSHCGHVEEGLDFHQDVTVTPPPKAIATNGEPFPWNDVRLPDFIVPLRYSVVLHPNLTTLLLRGQMEVVFAVQKETNFIVFHGKDVTLTVVMVRDKNMREIMTTRMLYYPYHRQIYIELKNYLMPGNNYSLALRYEDMVRTDLEGLYISSYKSPGGVKRLSHWRCCCCRPARKRLLRNINGEKWREG